ncbi:MAG TPA: NAD(P)-dependent oxidoreductase [Novosphingobium sp.]|nr:NAD(P)-dependent oxidoreductase [Novosphingobium sp.]
MAVLVTGGLGFIGSHLVREFLDHGRRVVATRFGGERLASFLDPHLSRGLMVEPLDVASPHAVIDICMRHGIESIVHLAGPPIGAVAPIEEYRINMTGLLNVLEAARIAGARRVSIASSIAVYMGLEGPLAEGMHVRLTPSHPIEAFKKAEELLGHYLAAAGRTDFVSLRLASIYGPLYRTLRHWPAQLVHAAVSDRPAPLDIAGLAPFHAGDHATDLCYVADCARGIRLVHESDRLRHNTYNIGGGENVSNQRFAEAAASVFPGLEIRMEAGVGPNNWPGSVMDLTRAAQDAGYAPRYSIEQALESYAAWLREGNPY